MKTIAFIVLSMFSITAIAQQDFEKYIIKNTDWEETPHTKWEETLTASKGSLYYFGAMHLDDPEAPQFNEIKNKWQHFKPTLAFYEGPDRGFADSDTATIHKYGESGYVRFLAKQSGIKSLSLEPSPVALYNYLCTKFSEEQVDLYLLTKEAMRLRTRKEMNKEQIEAELTKMLALFSKMLGRETSIKSIPQLANVFNQNFGATISWWEAPAAWFDPQKKENRSTNQLALIATAYRNVYMVDILSKNINNGERVFAVVGRNHVPLQISAIKYAVGIKFK